MRFEISQERLPELRNWASWYTNKLLRGKDFAKELTYLTQVEWVRRAFGEAGINSSKVTHTMRGASARHVDAHGVLEEQVNIPLSFTS